MEGWMIVAAIVAFSVVLAACLITSIVCAVILWRRFLDGVMRGVAAVYPLGLPQQGVRTQKLPKTSSIPPPVSLQPPSTPSRRPIPQPPPPAPKLALVPPLEEDRQATVAFPRYGVDHEEEVDTESDQGGPKSLWRQENDQGEGSNISLEGDITPRPVEPRNEPFRPKEKSKFQSLFRDKKR